jgi:hypothetical protein
MEPKSGKDLCPLNGSVLQCTSVGIEHIELFGSGLDIGGIDNEYSQSDSYVNDVILENLQLTAVKVGSGAIYSGPYTNISFQAYGSGTPTCVDLETQTFGLHGVTCTGNTNTDKTGGVGIIVNASNNTIEDVHIESFWDGIQVGPSSNPANVLISNVTGSTTGNGTGGPTHNTVHICGQYSFNSSFGTCGTSSTVEDVTVLHAMNDNSNAGQATIVDDSSRNGIVTCFTGSNDHAAPGCAIPLSTGIYALGEPYGQSEDNPSSYSIFTSSPTTPQGNYRNGSSYMPTWGVGTTSPSQYCSPAGAIYSLTNAGTNDASVYVCKPTMNQNYGTWVPIS